MKLRTLLAIGAIVLSAVTWMRRERAAPSTRLPLEHAPTLIFGSAGQHDGQFHMPRAVGFSPDGQRVYLLDRSHRVQTFDPQGQVREVWPTPVGHLGHPRGLDVSRDGQVYVADTHNAQVLVYTPDGKMRVHWKRDSQTSQTFTAVTDVALDSHGNVWTCEYGNYQDRISKVDPQGKLLLTVGVFGSEPGQFSRPQGLAVDARDYLYVADAVNHRIQVLRPNGEVERVWGEVGSAPGNLRYPYDVAFDPQGRLYIAEFGNHRISVFTPEGRFLTCFGRAGREPGQFNHPWGVNVARTGEIYVADTMNYRIQKFPPLPDLAASDSLHPARAPLLHARH